LTKRLVELHNGAIWVDSIAGSGSTFYVKLPQGTDELEVPVFSSQTFAPAGSEALMRVLVASESQDINHLIEIYLSGGPYESVIAADGLDLLRKAQEMRPSSILMGITLPMKDGWEVLRELKASPDTADIPVVIISAVDDRDLGLSLGAVEYMEKPVNREMLLAVLERIHNKPVE